MLTITNFISSIAILICIFYKFLKHIKFIISIGNRTYYSSSIRKLTPGENIILNVDNLFIASKIKTIIPINNFIFINAIEGCPMNIKLYKPESSIHVYRRSIALGLLDSVLDYCLFTYYVSKIYFS